MSVGNSHRLFFFDNLRYLMIILVVILHSAIGYSHIIPWWPVIDSRQSILLDILLAVGEVFTVPVLFFISGFFVISSIRKRGVVSFLSFNLIRLGLVWLALVLLVNPVLSYLSHYTRLNGFVSMSYGDFWIQYMQDTLRFKTGFIVTMDMIPSDQPKSLNHFNQYHAWFISLLMGFFCLVSLAYVLVRGINQRISSPPQITDLLKKMSPVLISCTMGVLIAVSVYIFHYYTYTYSNVFDPWISVGHIFQFQPSRIFLYLFSFFLGTFSSINPWYHDDQVIITRPTLWIICCGGLSGVYLFAINTLMDGPSLAWLGIYSLARTFLCISGLMIIISFSYRYWNQSSSFGRFLAKNSFNVYLIHLIFVVILQWLLLSWSWPGIGKWALISALSLIVSYALSHYMINRTPRLFVTCFLGIFISIIIFI